MHPMTRVFLARLPRPQVVLPVRTRQERMKWDAFQRMRSPRVNVPPCDRVLETSVAPCAHGKVFEMIVTDKLIRSEPVPSPLPSHRCLW